MPRPIDAIRRADSDGNPGTVQDATWMPLVTTPPFSSYTSGHSTFSGAAEVVLTHLFGDQVTFASRMDGHQGFTQRPLDERQITTWSFGSFAQAADEASKRGLYGGIHYEFDNVAGLDAGRTVGNHVIDNLLKPRF